MIEIRYLQAESGANKFGTCNCCGKSSSEDPLMISIKFSYYGHGTLICLCDDCKKKLIEALPPANNSEIPNSSDTISRQAAIEALTEYGNGRAVFISVGEAVIRIEQLPPIQPDNGLQKLADEIASFKRCVKSENSDYLTGYLCALSVVEGMIADMREVTEC